MKYAFDLAARENQTADVDATITSNTLNTGTDKEIVLQGTIGSLICDEAQLVETPVPFSVQNIEITSYVSTCIVRIYDNERHVLLKQIQDKWPIRSTEGDVLQEFAKQALKQANGIRAESDEGEVLQGLVKRVSEMYVEWLDDPRKHHYYRGLQYKDAYRVLESKLMQACLVRYGKPLQRTLRANTGLRRQVVTCLLTIHNLMSGTKNELEKQRYCLSLVRIYQGKAQVIPYESRAYNNPPAGAVDIDYALIHTLPITNHSTPVNPTDFRIVAAAHRYKALGYSKTDIAFILGLDETDVENALKEQPHY